MKALFTLMSPKKMGLLVLSLILATPMVYPEVVLAQQSLETQEKNQPLVFEIKDSSLIQKTLNPNLTYEELAAADPLAAKLKEYLEKHNSPLAEYADKIILEPQWQRALAISWVESNFGRRCADNNCSGIGVAPGHPSWRKYKTKFDWFKDMCQLLEKDIYKKKYTTFEQMRGVYVYPGSANWVNGAKSKYAQLMAITKEAEEERLAMQQNHIMVVAAAHTPEIAIQTD